MQPDQETPAAKHTPGPWRVVWYDCGDKPHYDHNGPCPLIDAPEDQDCAIVHWDGFKQQYWSSANGNQKQIEANAALIAAAPCMLAALTDAANLLSGIGQRDQVMDRVQATVMRAIAKATTL